MTPLKAIIEGAKGILAGLGRERLELDLEAMLTDEHRTIYLRGDNGSGKSTLINLALVPWREPPQLPGDIYDAFADTGLRELEWEHDGSRYRSRIEYRQTAKTKTQKAYLYVLDGQEWQPMQLTDHTVSDGKAKTYDRCLESILGDKDIYYLSAFRAQGAKRLAEYKDAKALMRGLLGLDELERKRLKTREVIKLITRDRAALRIEYTQAQADVEQIGRERDCLTELQRQMPRLREELSTATEDLAIATGELTAAMTEHLDTQKIVEARKAIKASITEETTRHARVTREIQTDITAADHAWDTQLGVYTRRESAAWSDIANAKRRLEAAEELLGQRDEINVAVQVVDSLTAELARNEQTNEEVQQKKEKLDALTREIGILQVRVEQAIADIKQMDERCHELEKRAGFVDEVPCEGKGKYAACPALQEALRAGDDLSACTGAIAIRQNDHDALVLQIDALKSDKAVFGDVETELQALKVNAATIRTRLEKMRKTAEKASGLAQAANVEDDVRQTIAARENAIEELNAEQAAAKEQHETKRALLRTRLAEVEDQHKEQTTDLAQKLAGLPEPESEAILEHAKTRVRTAEESKHKTATAVEKTTAEIATREATIAAGAEQEKKVHALAEQGRRLNDCIADLEYVVKGLKGIVDLSVEAAGPAIADYANQLLRDAGLHRFTVKIITQRTLANGTLAECFEISVIDSETDIESSVLHKSGGENVWLDKALTDAVGLYHQEAAGIQYETLFSDESDGALSAEKKTQYFRLDAKLLEIGGFRRKFAVSHSADAFVNADHVIEMADLRT